MRVVSHLITAQVPLSTMNSCLNHIVGWACQYYYCSKINANIINDLSIYTEAKHAKRPASRYVILISTAVLATFLLWTEGTLS